MSGSEEPWACELDVDALPDRAAQWNALAVYVRRSQRTAEGFRVVYSAEAKSALQTLIDAERVCCSWATWRVTAHSSEVVLEVTGPRPEVDTLACAFGV